MAIPSLTLDLIMSLDTESKAFWDPSDVEGELKRLFDICNSCCFTRCGFWSWLTVWRKRANYEQGCISGYRGQRRL
jgi:hypothetical protein